MHLRKAQKQGEREHGEFALVGECHQYLDAQKRGRGVACDLIGEEERRSGKVFCLCEWLSLDLQDFER